MYKRKIDKMWSVDSYISDTFISEDVADWKLCHMLEEVDSVSNDISKKYDVFLHLQYTSLLWESCLTNERLKYMIVDIFLL